MGEQETDMSRIHDKYKGAEMDACTAEADAERVGRAMLRQELRTRLIIYLFTPLCSAVFADIEAAFY